MIYGVFSAIAIACYGICATGLRTHVRRSQFAATCAAVFHCLALYVALHTPMGINLSPFNVASLVGLMVTLTVLSSSLRQQTLSLLYLILPVNVVIVALSWLAPLQYIVTQPSVEMVAHVLLSVAAYGMLAVAAVQSVLLSVQEWRLRHHKTIIPALPPLQAMEHLLFQFLTTGWLLLTGSLISGFLFVADFFGQQVAEKTALSLLAWLVFAGLLLGRWRLGWRGQVAVRWCVFGFGLLGLAYFGGRWLMNYNF